MRAAGRGPRPWPRPPDPFPAPPPRGRLGLRSLALLLTAGLLASGLFLPPAAALSPETLASAAPSAPSSPSFRSLPPLPSPPLSQLPGATSAFPALSSFAGGLFGANDFGTPPWHLISIPVEPDDVTASQVIATAAPGFELAYAYDACSSTDPWRVLDPADAASSDLAQVDHRLGVWVKAPAPDPSAVAGTQPAETTIQLCTGWNLIGYPLAQARPVPAALASIAGKYQRVYGFDPADLEEPWRVFDVDVPSWANTLQSMEPGRGYWVYAGEDSTLVLRNTGPPPEVEITSPTEGSAFTSAFDVVGSVRSDLLQGWELAYRMLGAPDFAVFATGNVPISDDVIGTLDPGPLLNGMYDLQLSATDFEGRTAVVSIRIVVEGERKIGHFVLPLLDLELPLVGIPIQIVRTYNSRDKRQGDFGVGWRLSFSDLLLQENTVPGLGYEGTRSGIGAFQNYCIDPTILHTVSVVFPGGQVERFQPVFEPPCQLFVPQQVVDVRYQPLPGSDGTLEFKDREPRVLVVGSFPGPVELWDQFLVEPFNPDLFEYTTEDGRKFLIQQDEGLVSLTDANDNTLTFTDGGITGPNGIGVTFERDAEGRITKIIDPLDHEITYTYDANGDLANVTDQEDLTTRYTYIGDHFLETIIDPDGTVTVAAEYDGDGLLIRSCDLGQCNRLVHEIQDNTEVVIDPSGRQVTYVYDNRGHVERFIDGLDNETVVEHDEVGNILSITRPDGAKTSATYDAKGNRLTRTDPHTEEEDPADYTTTYTWNGFGKPTTIIFPTGAEVRMSYDTRGNLEEVRDEAGNLLLGYDYDSAGNVIEQSHPFGSLSYSDYNDRGEAETIVDEIGVVLNNSFDANGQLRTMVDDGVTTTVDWDAKGRETLTDFGNGLSFELGYGLQDEWTTVTSPGEDITRRMNATGRILGWELEGGATVDYDLDPAGRLTRQLRSDGRSWSYAYDPAGRLSTFTDTEGAVTEYDYDSVGNVLEMRDALDFPTRWTYNPRRQVTSVTDARNHTSTFRYELLSTTVTDPLDRETTFVFSPHGLPIETRFPGGTTQKVEYLLTSPLVDAESFPTLIEDEGGRVRTFGYDQWSRQTTATDTAQEVWTFTYDDEDGLRQITDPDGVLRSMTYDGRDNLETVTYPEGGTERYRYDAANRLDKITRQSGREVNQAWDVSGSLSARTGSTGEAETFTWRPEGPLEEMTGAPGTTTFGYDGEARLTRLTQGDGGSVEYERDLMGQVTKVTARLSATSAPYVTDYTYDAVGNLVEIEDPLGGITTFDYDAADRLIRRELPNGVVTDYTYDLRDRPDTIFHRADDGTVIRSVDYDRLPGGEPEKITWEDGSYVELSYDDAFRLTGEDYFDSAGVLVESTSYTYTPAGDRLTFTDGAGTRAYGYLPGHQLSTVSGVGDARGYTYVDGDVATVTAGSETRTLQHDFVHRLTSVDASGGTGGNTSVSYVYDPEGRRVASTVSDGTDTVSRRFVVGPTLGEGLDSTHLAADETGSLKAGYVFAGEHPLMRFGGSGPIYYLGDGFGSVLGLADDSATEVARFQYDGFGRIREESGPERAAPAGTGGDFRFHGGWLEEATGYYHFRARDYDPEIGRFLTRDPAIPDFEVPESLHPYQFSYANPRVFRDPTGQFSIPSFNISAAINGIIGGIKSVALRRALFKVKKEIAEAVTDFLIDFVFQLVAANTPLGPAMSALDFEGRVEDAMCNALRTNSLYIEPAVKRKGKPRTNGISCNARAGGAKPPKPHATARPDFLFGSRAPKQMRRGHFESYVIGDVKKTVAYAYRTWKGKQTKQRDAIKNHSARWGVRVAALVSLSHGRKTKRGRASIRKRTQRLFTPDTYLFIMTFL